MPDPADICPGLSLYHQEEVWREGRTGPQQVRDDLTHEALRYKPDPLLQKMAEGLLELLKDELIFGTMLQWNRAAKTYGESPMKWTIGEEE